MTGNPKTNPIAPAESEPFEIRRRRELLAELKLYDGGLASLTAAIREARMENGYFVQAPLAMNAVSLKLRTLLSGLNQLSRWHSETLAALAQL